jgi:hypothetical protein
VAIPAEAENSIASGIMVLAQIFAVLSFIDQEIATATKLEFAAK